MGIIFWSAFCWLGVKNVCVHSNLCCVTEFLMIRLSFNSWSRWQKAPDGETELDFKTLILWGLRWTVIMLREILRIISVS